MGTAAFCDISLHLSALSLDFGSLGRRVLCSAMCTVVLDGPLTGSANGCGHGGEGLRKIRTRDMFEEARMNPGVRTKPSVTQGNCKEQRKKERRVT